MENKLVLLVAAISLLLALSCQALPSGESVLEDSSLSADKRPKYMDTRRDLDIFKYMLMASIKELVEEGRLNPAMLPREEEGDDNETTSIEKRMQYMGICMRRRQNTLIPYPCLRSGVDFSLSDYPSEKEATYNLSGNHGTVCEDKGTVSVVAVVSLVNGIYMTVREILIPTSKSATGRRNCVFFRFNN